MQPFFFGPAQALYGAYHPPLMSGPEPETAIVLCQSIGHEYMRAHRACWQFGEAAARRNAHVLRFDYSATGDSGGAPETADWARWLDDVATACRWLREETGLARIRLVGLRVGALVAAEATRTRLGALDIDAVVFWDPVVDGAAFMAALHAQHRQDIRARNRYRPQRLAYDENGGQALLGFAMPESVRNAIASADLARSVAAQRGRHWRLSGLDMEHALAVQIQASGGPVIPLHDDAVWADVSHQFRRVVYARSMPGLVDLAVS